jgi:hypothetical protein
MTTTSEFEPAAAAAPRGRGRPRKVDEATRRKICVLVVNQTFLNVCKCSKFIIQNGPQSGRLKKAGEHREFGERLGSYDGEFVCRLTKIKTERNAVLKTKSCCGGAK